MTRKQLSATNARNLRTLLLLNVFEPEEIGERIKIARDRAGLRQEDLADLIGMSTRQIQNYEAGATKQYSKLRAIAAATQVPVEWLLHGGDPITHPDGDDLAQLHEDLAEVQRTLARIEETLRSGSSGEPEEQAAVEAES